MNPAAAVFGPRGSKGSTMKLFNVTKTSCSAVLLAFSIGALASHAAQAQAAKTDDAAKATMQKACADDFKKFCTNSDGSKVKKCTQTNLDKFTAECRASVEEFKKSKGKS
jgi:hypothetical protein